MLYSDGAGISNSFGAVVSAVYSCCRGVPVSPEEGPGIIGSPAAETGRRRTGCGRLIDLTTVTPSQHCPMLRSLVMGAISAAFLATLAIGNSGNASHVLPHTSGALVAAHERSSSRTGRSRGYVLNPDLT
jgi:hypothetical protein